ncbi:sigma-70 family RNA polymerase sigma factor [Asticcacaulis sp. 201]|uniref:RNA polymerase sigma factor n=1 Tax=Asticcacaulis sp. 201 TaxID=3028787 RepID=UPI0029170D76|nr:sigma-70 family RNA polymerase sigma factor [Asticcacaulis sp. 201]MDV6330696.1 sigma-70 family RNA polymerase sigma factor [Asticcacaulis sp. 201]
MPEPENIIHLPGRLAEGHASAATTRALAAVIEAYDRRLWRYLGRRLAQDDIADARQDVYGRLTRILSADPTAQLSAAYIFKTADSIVRDHFRRRRVRHHDSHIELEDHVAAETPSAFDTLHWRQNLNRVRQALDKLPQVQRRVLLLHRLDGMSLPEVAQELGVPLRTVERHLSRALVACRITLEEAGWPKRT